MSKSIAPMEVRFIKLGPGGSWEKSSIEDDQVIRLGYQSQLHAQSLAGDWGSVSKFWLDVRKGKSAPATSDVRQIRDFYERPATTLWFTFYRRLLWWCFAEEQVQLLEDESRIRAVKDKWQSADLLGRPLSIDTLDGRLTTVGMYRGTICEVRPEVADYLVRRINGKQPPEVRKAQEAVAQLEEAVDLLVKGLFWQDFELLTDLMFSRAGYKRVDVLGKTVKAIDLDLEAPVTRRRAFVQVKSSWQCRSAGRQHRPFQGHASSTTSFSSSATPGTRSSTTTQTTPESTYSQALLCRNLSSMRAWSIG